MADEIVKEVTDDSNDMDSAYQAALKKARRLAGEDYEVFHRRVGDFLKRRGFGYAVIHQTVKRLWQETKELSTNL